MKRAIWIGVLAVVAFAGILLARLPANWFASALPSEVSCAQISGTVWNGSCGGLVWRNAPLGTLNWQWYPRSLLRGVLRAQLSVDGPAGNGRGTIAVRRGGQIVAQNLKTEFALNPSLIPSMPADLRGRVSTDLSLLRVENGRIASIEGQIEAHDLQRRRAEIEALGDYVVVFPAGAQGDPVGDLRSLKGPLNVEGKLKLTREPGFVLDGTIAPGAGASMDLIQQVEALGTSDERGRRPFSVAGTF